ncbi:MAG: hypothetical protein SYC29_11670 [Planctomycetota bacterium]|nr:hypothetical protein [Planctomycetota bacterium]
MTERPRRRLILRLGVAALVPVLLGPLTACYERVVRTKGIGTERVDVYEPNLKEEHERIPVVDDVEDAIFGPKKREKDKKTRR